MKSINRGNRMHRKHIFISIVLFMTLIVSCSEKQIQNIQEKAPDILASIATAWGGPYADLVSNVINILKVEDVLPGDSIEHELYDKTYTPYSFNTPKWVFFVDNSYLYNSSSRHAGSYVFIDYHDGSMYSSLSNIPRDITHYDTVYYEWKRQNLVYPNLSFNDSLSPYGCIDFEIYIENEDENAFIWIKADTSKLKLSDQLQQFDLNIQYEGLAVGIDFYYYLPPNSISMASAYCNDLLFYKDPPKIFTAEEGNIFLKVFSDSNKVQGYAAYVRLENILFRDHEGRTVQLDQYEVKSVRVGWYPG